MRIPRSVRGFLLSAVIIVTGAAQAAYPTPGGESLDFQVHPVALGDVQAILDDFLELGSSEAYSLVADPRTGSIVAVAPARVQRRLAAFIQERTAEDMRRFVVEMQISRAGGAGRHVLGEPRLEVPAGERRSLNLDGAHRPGGPDWRTRLEVAPEATSDGKIRLRLRGHTGQDGEDVVVTLAPGEPLVIDEAEAPDPRMRALARELNQGRQGGEAYSVTLSVRPL